MFVIKIKHGRTATLVGPFASEYSALRAIEWQQKKQIKETTTYEVKRLVAPPYAWEAHD